MRPTGSQPLALGGTERQMLTIYPSCFGFATFSSASLSPSHRSSSSWCGEWNRGRGGEEAGDPSLRRSSHSEAESQGFFHGFCRGWSMLLWSEMAPDAGVATPELVPHVSCLFPSVHGGQTSTAMAVGRTKGRALRAYRAGHWP